MKNVFSRNLDANNSILLLVDYQDKLFEGIESHSCTDIKNNVIALANGAQALGIPALLTTFQAKVNGPFLPELVDIFPHASIINRELPSFDILEDHALLEAVIESGKKQVLLSGLWSSMCMCHTSLHGLREGFDVLGVMDTTGSEPLEAHNAALHRMIQDGVVCTCHLAAGRFRMDV